MLGAAPILGRTFVAAEDQPGGARVLVVSFDLWQRRFGGDASIVGKTIALGGASYTVIGVLSPRFRPYPPANVWFPLQADPNSTDQAHLLTAAGRLPPGAILAQANSWMKVLGERYIQAHPRAARQRRTCRRHSHAAAFDGERTAGVNHSAGRRRARAADCLRQRRQLVARPRSQPAKGNHRARRPRRRPRAHRTPTAHRKSAAGADGWVGGPPARPLGVRVLVAFAPGGLPRIQEMARVPALDARVVVFSVTLSVLTAVLFGLLPAFQLSRVDLVSSFEEAGGRAATGLKQGQTRNVLVAAEMAIAVVLLCGAMLLMRSFLAMHSVAPGFDPRNLLTLKVALAGPEDANAGAVGQLAYQTAQRIERIPGVERATVASSLPTQAIADMIFDIPGRPPLERFEFTGDVLWCFVSPNYFDTLRIPLLSGRGFREQEPPHTVIINEAMRRRFWPQQDPVGRSILIGASLGPPLEQGSTEIVGVVGDVRELLDADPPATMYQVWSNVPGAGIKMLSQMYPASVAVRTKPGVAPMSVSQAVEQALLARDTQLPATKVQTMDRVMLESTAQKNFDLLLLGIFAASALLLAAVGIFGVTSFSVQQRTHEIGIRVALGAPRSSVLALVLGQGLAAAMAGVGIGIVAALALTRFLSSLLFGVKPNDPLTFGIVALVLAGIALLAAYIPARPRHRSQPHGRVAPRVIVGSWQALVGNGSLRLGSVR